MMRNPTDEEALRAENADLRARLAEVEETLEAIRAGEVDALVVDSTSGPQIFILQGVDAQSNRFRSDILGKVSDAVVAIDDSRHVIYLNAAAEQQYHVTASDVLGHDLSELYEFRWLREEDEIDSRESLRTSGQWRGRNIHVKKNGEIIHVESSVSVLYTPEGRRSGLLGVIRDITAQSAAAEALRESEERYRTLFNSIDEGFCILEVLFDEEDRAIDYRYLQISPSFERQTGIKDAIGKTIRELVPSIEQYWMDAYGSVALTGESIRLQRYVESLGRHFDVYASRFGAPEKRQVAVIFDDVTERKIAEDALRQNEALFSKILEQAPGGVYVVDDHFRVMRVNSLARPTFAHAEPVIGRDFCEVMEILWGPEVGLELTTIFRHTLETGERYIPPRLTAHRYDLGVGKSYDWETQRLTLPNGRHGVVCYFTDVTEQQNMEEALRASEQRANNIIQSITDGFLTMDHAWSITYLSARGAEILAPLQKTPDNVVGKVFWDEFPHAVGTAIEANCRRAMEHHEPVQFEAFYPPLDRWFDLRVYPSASGLSLFFLDITERKATESALRESQRVLAEQAAALRLADRSKDEFLAMLAHELRNPLAPMRNATDILQAPNASAADREHAQQLIGRQIGNMTRMIDDLLDVSRITEGKIELRSEAVVLNDILKAAADAIIPACRERGQVLTVSMPAEPLFINADATRLEQVFGNLLGNASKYGGDRSRIHLAAELGPKNEVAIRVADDGIGIDPELLPRIFDLFVQSSRTLDRSHGGLGIGLTIVHRLVKLHGGSIEAKSEGYGKGTEITVRLPLLPSGLSLLKRDVSAPRAARSLRMLIVDDNRDSAETMAMLQQLYGHVTRVAHTGPDAVSAAMEFLPDVTLLDIGLPGMDGFEVARRIRAMPELRDSFLIAVTGYGTEADRLLAREAGFDELLSKPANLELLQDWLRSRV